VNETDVVQHRAPVTAMTFDYWNTIVRPTEAQLARRLEGWRLRYAEAGHDVDEELLRGVFAAVWDEHQAAWRRNEQYTGDVAARRAIELLALPVDPPTEADLVDRFITPPVDLGLCDGVAGLIAALAERDVRLGIVCDVGFSPSTELRRVLERHDLLHWFTGWSFSDEVGWYKPAPEIFHHALGYLGVPADRVAHIGDLRRTDVAGARGMGMVAVRYRGVYDDTSDGPEGDVVVGHHDEVLAALGL
jgi:putative hydrolase of the HAD superfamily